MPTEALRLTCIIPDWEICTASRMISKKHYKRLPQSRAGHSARKFCNLPVTHHDCPSPWVWTVSNRTAVIMATVMMTPRRKYCPILSLTMLHQMVQVRTRKSIVMQRNFAFPIRWPSLFLFSRLSLCNGAPFFAGFSLKCHSRSYSEIVVQNSYRSYARFSNFSNFYACKLIHTICCGFIPYSLFCGIFFVCVLFAS